MEFSYVNIVTEGCGGWLNLFFGDHVIALVDNIYIADLIRKSIPEQNNKLIEADAENVRTYPCPCCSGSGRIPSGLFSCEYCKDLTPAEAGWNHCKLCGRDLRTA